MMTICVTVFVVQWIGATFVWFCFVFVKFNVFLFFFLVFIQQTIRSGGFEGEGLMQMNKSKYFRLDMHKIDKKKRTKLKKWVKNIITTCKCELWKLCGTL